MELLHISQLHRIMVMTSALLMGECLAETVQELFILCVFDEIRVPLIESRVHLIVGSLLPLQTKIRV